MAMENNKIKISLFPKNPEDTEVLKSLERYARYVGLQPYVQVLDLSGEQPEGFFDHIAREDTLPLILVLNPERSLNDYIRYAPTNARWLCTLIDIFHHRYAVLCFPFEINGLKAHLSTRTVNVNPFKLKELKEKAKKIKGLLKFKAAQNTQKQPTKGWLWSELGEWISEEERRKKKWPGTHGRENDPPEKFKPEMWFYHLLLAHLFQKRDNRKLKILWIDNNPERKLDAIDSRLPGLLNKAGCGENLKKLIKKICEVWGCEIDLIDGKDEQFDAIYERLARYSQQESEKAFARVVPLNNSSRETREIKFKDLQNYSLILVDIFLGAERHDGVKFVQAFTRSFPQIPAFILSVCDDYEVISEALKGGADFYILKSEVLVLPFAYYLYIRKLGRVLEFINSEQLRRSLIGNVRYWNFKRNFLWFGDKCYHMVDHSFRHSHNDWVIANEILYHIFRERGVPGVSDEFLYSFLMAIWLHDIGHKGNRKYGEPYQIRDNHGYLAAELIVKYPELLGICDDDGYYRELDFGQEGVGSILEVMLDRKRRGGLSITERIALFALFHKSNCPITREEYNSISSKNPFAIPVEYFQGGERKRERALTLERIVEALPERAKEDREWLIPFAFLLRFIDGLDIHTSRVGDQSEERLRRVVVENDKRYVFEKLKKAAKSLAPDPASELLWVTNLAQNVIGKIEAGEEVSFDELSRFLSSAQEWEDYIMLVNYASFVALQPGHFKLHSAVEEIKIGFRDRLAIEIFLCKTKAELEREEILERGRPRETVWERIKGNREKGINSYFVREMALGWRHLRKLLEEPPLIILRFKEKEGAEWQEEPAVFSLPGDR